MNNALRVTYDDAEVVI